MPTTYAHYKFGEDVLNILPLEYREIIESNKELYSFGLHGPDLLFYYHSLAYFNSIVSVGRKIHHESGSVFFENAARVLRERNYNDADLAFIYGYICHFALDISCHGYINERVDKNKIPHSTTEAEFDRFLLLKDGVTQNPAGYSPVGHLCPSYKSSKVMCRYYKNYPCMTSHKLFVSEKSMIRTIKIITARNEKIRIALKRIMRLGGPYIGGLVMDTEPDARCDDSNVELSRRYEKALPIAVKLIKNLIPSSKSGNFDKEYSSKFDPMSTSEELKI